MKKTLALVLLATSFLLLTNCSKDKRVERTLYKKDGQWSISNVTWQKVVQDTSGQHVTSGSSSNVGTFTFDKDGSGSYSFTIDGSSYSQSFTWTVNDEKISITKISQSVDIFSGSVDQLAVAFTGTRESKSSIKLEGTETHQYVGGSVTVSQNVLAGTFTLSR